MSIKIKKGFVNVNNGQVHYRMAGSGPPIILLHDSPRSSVLHIPLLEYFSDTFTVIAIDTPGYGNSSALSANFRPEIPDFADALAETIVSFGVERCPVYGFHTSSKILLEFAANHPNRVSIAIMDGLSLPAGDTDHDFIKHYMRPFKVTETGSYLAEEWTRVRDFQRWFPWFQKNKTTRMPLDQKTIMDTHQYSMDLFMAGPNFSDAYSAAMRYKPLPVISSLKAKCIFMAREDDVLYPFLDMLPDPLPAKCAIEKLSANKEKWRLRLREIFNSHADFDGAGTFVPPNPFTKATDQTSITQSYVDSEAGQVLVRKAGEGNSNPIIFLHDLPGSCRSDEILIKALGRGRTCFGIDLPGCNESDPLNDKSSIGYIRSLTDILSKLNLGSIDIVADGLSCSLALLFAFHNKNKVRRLVLDGMNTETEQEIIELRSHYLPILEPEISGSHLHKCWHMLRDQEIQWPWYNGSSAAIRAITPDLDAWKLHVRLVDTLKQYSNAKDAILASLEINIFDLLPKTSNEVLIFDRMNDIRYAGAKEARNLLVKSRQKERHPDPLSRARQILEFLD